jgi:type IV secretory pathway VirB3-like protein
MKSKDSLVYTILWKPQVTLGLPRDLLALIGLISIVPWPFTRNILICIIVAALLYGLGWLLTLHDPDFVSVVKAKIVRCGNALGNFKGNEYHP